jgi:(4-alkanoyl-5-oxo-2,5-dihydrofuran-3-yl)methyl phosphate reductase
VPITGPEALSFSDVTARIGAAIGKPLEFIPISDEEARRRYSAVSGSVEETEAHVALWRAIREQRLASVNDNVEQILGRKAIALDQWITENSEAFRA